ncbi:MAG TPA: EF-P beta-lysylation protein EpmB, partial [Psychromonas hadalis]|nr:EF-P beta-lysylation protein EpmB [Psychromonas hadalis]
MIELNKITVRNDNADVTTWQYELANAVKNPQQLCDILRISADKLNLSDSARKAFPMIVPRPFVKKMKKGDIDDPLLKQVLPINDEEKISDGYSIDPLGEHQNGIQGLLHKYQSRVLLIVKSGCAINCRYCFRRHFPYQDNTLNKAQLQQVVDYLQSEQKINEVILSGGDPLMSKDYFLQTIVEQISGEPQIKRLRIHTRLPVVIPTRVTQQLCEILKSTRLNVTLVLHINHANEIDEDFKVAMQKLRKAGVQLLNQSVLLKGVNDSATALIDLSEALSDAGILPYYLFLLDKVQGAQHFDLEE